MTTKKRPGFGGQWVEVFSTGTHTDDAGNPHNIDAAFIDAVVTNLNLDLHEPPVVIGHPKHDAPAFGWPCALRRNGEVLEAQLCDTDPQFEEMVRKGLFKKRSASFYLDADKAPGGQVPALRHIGFLGAAPPAVKGLRDIHFEEGVAATFEFSEGAPMTTDKEKEKSIPEQIAEFFREKFGVAKDAPAASFSEGDAQKLIEGAVAKVEASFTEKITALEKENKSLRETVDQQGGSTKRAAIVSFCESNLAKVIPAFNSMGMVEFMETLDNTTSKAKITVISFAEGDKEEKHEMSQLDWFQDFIKSLPPFISFGEKFGELRLKGDGSAIVDPGQIDALRDGMGVKASEAAK